MKSDCGKCKYWRVLKYDVTSGICTAPVPVWITIRVNGVVDNIVKRDFFTSCEAFEPISRNGVVIYYTGPP